MNQTPKTSPKTESFHLPAHLLSLKLEEEFQNKLLGSINYTRLASWHYALVEYTLLFLFGALFAFAFPGWSFSFLAWFGLLPLIFFTLKHTSMSALFRGWIWGVGFSLVAYFWMQDIAFLAHVAITLTMACFPALFASICSFCYRFFITSKVDLTEGFKAQYIAYEKVPVYKTVLFTFFAGATWATIEWIQTYIFTGLPWNILAVTQWENINFLQLCEWTSFYGMSFLICTLNMGIYFAVASMIRYIRFGLPINLKPFLFASIVLCLILITISPNVHTYAHTTKPKPNQTLHKIGAVQTDITVSWGKPFSDLQNAQNQILNNSAKLVYNDKAEVIFWPETVLPLYYNTDQKYQAVVENFVRTVKTPLVIGTSKYLPHPKNPLFQNIAQCINVDGTQGDMYAKTHLVPFGEFIPLSRFINSLFPELQEKFYLPNNLTPGEDFTPLRVTPELKAGMNICFEDIFPDISRKFTANGAHFLVTIANDGWYPNYDERIQHLAHSVFRCVENRRYMVRTANMAPATLIAPTGEIVEWYKATKAMDVPFDGMKSEHASVTFNVLIPDQLPTTFYTRYGNIFVFFCAVLTFLGLLLAALKKLTVYRLINRVVTAENNPIHTRYKKEKTNV